MHFLKIVINYNFYIKSKNVPKSIFLSTKYEIQRGNFTFKWSVDLEKNMIT
jgi:hypothetical protein